MGSLRAVAVCLAAAFFLAAPAFAQQTGRFEKTIEGFEKPVLADIPKSYTASRCWGLVVGLHGTGMSGPRIAGAFDVASIHKAGYLTVFPTSHQGAWATMTSGGTDADQTKEILYLKAVLETFAREYNVHPNKIHLVGFSAGSVISSIGTGMRTEWGDIRIRSINCHSGGLVGPVQMRPDRKAEMAVWVLNGTNDAGHAEPARNIAESFKRAGYDSKFTEVPGAGHSFPLAPWTEIVAWWQELDKNAPDLTVAVSSLARAERELAKKKYSAAYKSYGEAIDAAVDKSEAVVKKARAGLAVLAGQAEAAMAEALPLMERDPKKAKRLLRDIARLYQGTPYADEAEKLLKELP